ncbi:DNA circularization N-terminal domain-containing protein [Chitinivorax sp. PXF-14]|uniref:DNA circularization protein n=1 Tax=Chitinivorax sp. PXF-14 TaxID=3230488 RepID=UPI0034677125
MAWSDSLLDCSFRGVTFDVTQTDDGAERSLVEHAYPWLDGASVEDLGRAARSLRINAVLFGDDYEQRLQDLLAELDQPGAGELIHPVFGSVWAQLRSWQVQHTADAVDQCVLTLVFVETDRQDQPFFARELPAQQADAVDDQGAQAEAAVADATAEVVDDTVAANPLAALDSLRQSLTGPVLAGLAQVQGLATSGLDVLKYPRAWANDLSAIVSGIQGLRNFDKRLLAEWGALTSIFRSLNEGWGSRKASTTHAVAALRPGVAPSEVQAVAAAQVHVTVQTAVATASAAAMVLTAEADPARAPDLSPADIEQMVNDARQTLLDAMTAVRALYPLEQARTICEPLKQQAAALQLAAQSLIELRPPLQLRALDVPGNLRLLAHAWYGDHNRAPELARLNPLLRLPNALQAGDRLYGYAK